MTEHPALSIETSGKIGNSLRILKALGDSLVCIGKAGADVALLDDTVATLGHLVIDLADKVGVALEVL